MRNRDLPASPIGEQIDAHHLNAPCNGLTKLEMISMHLYSGMLSACDQSGEWTGIDCAADAVSQACQLLQALSEEQEQ